ncbi:hypothetical protein NECAME_13339 [Necator americanus]|uniref:Uncharacterized protein n=1 Tax=Necator americanus TaxID=51031 RepID=W2SVZ6_NECAM|nr:hypothetical protein NECAME_13339 [Necator americanus]ETN73919.1 hypothetical protein NECAME_13339 [Necator americanus]
MIRLRPLHALILNAGVFSPTQKMTIDGLEMTFGVNHVAHQYLVRELLPLLRQSNARVVVVASTSHCHTGSLEQGAATTVYCAASPEVHEVSGKYWESCWDDEKNFDEQLARDEELQDALWEKTDKLLDKFESDRQPIKTVTEAGNK